MPVPLNYNLDSQREGTTPITFSSVNLIKNSLPLAYHVNEKIRNIIFNNEYVDFAALLPQTQSTEEIHVIATGVKLMTTSNSNPKAISSMHQWNNAFDIFLSIYLTKYPHMMLDLIKYGNNMRKLGYESGIQAVKLYDEEFRKLRVVHRLDWVILHDELYRLATAIKHSGNYQQHSQSSGSKNSRSPFLGKTQQKQGKYPNGFCWRYCDTGMCGSKACKLKHQCVHCGQKHASDICNKRPTGDDFVFVSKASSKACDYALHSFLKLCKTIGVPIKHEKTRFPTTVLTIYGIEIDSNEMIARLPSDKIEKIYDMLVSVKRRRSVTLRDLQSLIGLLNFACSVIIPGRAFLRRLINLTLGHTNPQFRITLNAEARADLRAWFEFIEHFNGKLCFLFDNWVSSDTLRLYSDAAGVHGGFAAVFGNDWFTGDWPPEI
ncbi:Hypothetical predicted protein [Mytilus galloprovincialis]|uniref:C3H1-type domain-containing protein n=1 Tax=Mytilus galloprovincialis TaxID=29158 RepID=A0A8B6CEV9_MYTGA|nr:Hypothetical predicted protein [Mytilus galloprovincialis]